MSEGEARESREGMCAGEGQVCSEKRQVCREEAGRKQVCLEEAGVQWEEAGVQRGSRCAQRRQGWREEAGRRQVCTEEAGVSACSLTGLLSSPLARCGSQLGAGSRVAPSGSLG